MNIILGSKEVSMKKAFTMAEVLITLGVIGIVVAMTLPSLINRMNDKQNIAKWKKEYSVLSNAFNIILAEDIPICMYYSANGDCTYGDKGYLDFSAEFMEKIKNTLQVVSFCSKSGKVDRNYECDNYNSDYWKKNSKYKWSGTANIYSQYKALGVSKMSNPNSYSPYGLNAYNFNTMAYLLNDGAAVYFGGLWDGPWIVVDVNNFQNGPNEVGRDVFIIKVYSNYRKREHWMRPAGAKDTPGYNKAESGSYGCSSKIGLQTSNTIYDAAGAGCSAKYLLE